MKKLLTVDTAFSRYFKVYRIFFYLVNAPDEDGKPNQNVLAETIILSEAWSWTETTETGEFYKSESQWLTEFGITRSQLRIARKHLKTRRFLDSWRKRRRGPLWFAVNKVEIIRSVEQYMRMNPRFFERKFNDGMPELSFDNVTEFPRRKIIGGKPIKKAKRLGVQT